MKNLRKLLAVVVVVAMMATFMIPAFAQEAELSDVEICEKLGMLKGTGDGVTVEYLTSPTERNQAAIMFLRLQGLEDEALAYDGEDNFDDADELWSGGQAILAYLKANPDLGWQGVGDNKFEPRATIDAKSYYKVMLEALGYKQEVDFLWSNVLEFAAEKGLSAIAPVEEVTNAEIAAATVEALKATVKDSEQTLIEKLVADGIVSQEAAVEVGLISGELSIAEFKAAGAKIMTVRFNKAVEDTSKMVFGLKRNETIKVSIKEVTWNDAKTEATLAVSYKLLDGDYTVTATYDGGEAMTATAAGVKEAKVSAITFTRDKAIVADKDTVNPPPNDQKLLKAFIKIENQYGEDVSKDVNQSELSVSASKGTFKEYKNGVITLDAGTDMYEVDKTVVVTVVHKATSTVGTETLTVSQAAEVASIEFGEVTPEDKDMAPELRVGCDYDRYYIPITVKDQYGNVLKKDEINLAATLSSDTSILNVGTIETVNDQTVLKLDAPVGDARAGTVTITAVALTGKTATITVVVKETNAIDTLSLQAPESPLKLGVWSIIPFTAVDPYGVQLVKASDLAPHTDAGSEGGDALTDTSIKFADGTTVSVTNASIKMDVDYDNDARLIKVRPNTANVSVTFTAVTSKAKVQTMTLSVEEAPKPKAIAGLKDAFKRAIATGVTETLKLSHIKLTDQYGDSIELPNGYEIKISGPGAGGNFVKVQVDPGTGFAAAPVTFQTGATPVTQADIQPAAAQKGSETIKVELIDAAGPSVVDSYTFTMQSVDFKDITAFEIDTLKKFYVGEITATDAAHALAFEVVGLKGSTKVKVPQDKIAGASSNVANTSVDLTEKKIKVDNKIDTKDADMTGKLTVIYEAHSGTKTLTKDFVYSSAAPIATVFEIRDNNDAAITSASIEVATTDIDGKYIGSVLPSAADTFAPFRFYAEDQYGVAMSSLSYVVTSVTGGAPSVGADGKVALGGAVAGDSFHLTVITNNGMTKNLRVILK